MANRVETFKIGTCATNNGKEAALTSGDLVVFAQGFAPQYYWPLGVWRPQETY
ncbi:MAG: hypothetical protein K9K21_02885 [Desulfotignum sp.]|nr:hypothetical protein [Desulfotignum sp.]